MKHWTKDLEIIRACSEAIEWARAYPSLDAAWAECQRGDWMAWLAGRCSGEAESSERKVLVIALCEIARKVLHLTSPGEDRPRVAIETAESWARGEAVIKDVRAASRAADAARADADAASDAAYALASAAYATSATSYAAYVASAASYAAYAAASASAYASSASAASATYTADAAASYASYAATYAAYASSAYAAASAYAAYASAYAASAYVADATTGFPIADIMRKHYPTPPMLNGMPFNKQVVDE